MGPPARPRALPGAPAVSGPARLSLPLAPCCDRRQLPPTSSASPRLQMAGVLQKLPRSELAWGDSLRQQPRGCRRRLQVCARAQRSLARCRRPRAHPRHVPVVWGWAGCWASVPGGSLPASWVQPPKSARGKSPGRFPAGGAEQGGTWGSGPLGTSLWLSTSTANPGFLGAGTLKCVSMVPHGRDSHPVTTPKPKIPQGLGVLGQSRAGATSPALASPRHSLAFSQNSSRCLFLVAWHFESYLCSCLLLQLISSFTNA